MEFSGATNAGCVRTLNEDSFFIQDKAPVCLLVSDGMGGHNAGEIASGLIVHAVERYLKSNYEPIRSDEDGKKLIVGASYYANSIVYSRAAANKSYSGMGATLVMAVLEDGKAYIGNVGDSRLYAVSESEIRQITVDHSVVEQLVREGSITKEEAKQHPQRNVITRALGTEFEVKTDFYVLDLAPYDYIFLCSDGLTGMVDEAEIQRIIYTYEAPQPIIEKLIAVSNENGGADNITVVLAKLH